MALNNEDIKKDAQRITKNKPFISNYNWEGIHFLSEKDYLKKFEKNNVTTALNVLYVKKKILLTFQNINQIVRNKLFIC